MPDHQRDFAWTDEEVEQFLNDVIGAIQDSEEDYFLGLVVVVKPGQVEKPWEVLDGQQRLATTTMVYAAIREWAILSRLLRQTPTSCRMTSLAPESWAKPRLLLD